jgi:hypothetical protein
MGNAVLNILVGISWFLGFPEFFNFWFFIISSFWLFGFS